MSKEEIIDEKFEEIVYIKKENVNKKKQRKQKKKAVNTKACGSSTSDVTLVHDFCYRRESLSVALIT